MIPLKYSTASQEIPLGYFLDETDGKTAETGLTIANTDIKLWKNGATTLANKNSGGATHISGGIYYAVLDDTDTNTYGPMKIFVHVSGALPCILECLVMEADAYDALYAAAGTGHIEADMVQISGDATAANNAELDYDGTGYAKANSTMGTCTTNTDMVAAAPTAAANADAVWDEASTGHTDAGKAGEQMWTDVDAILVDTSELQVDDVPGLIAALNNLSEAQVNTQIDGAFTTQMADSVSADGTIPTREQALYMIAQFLWEKAVSGTTVTAKKVDGSTSLMTFTLDDASNPTSITRAT